MRSSFNSFADVNSSPSDTAVIGPRDPSRSSPSSSDFFFDRNIKSFSSPTRSTKSSWNFSPCSKRVKRRNSDDDDDDSFKQTKRCSSHTHYKDRQDTNNMHLTLQNINLNEYPKFHHPDGGFIQFTPIGNVRTFLGDNDVVQRIVEKNSTFDLSKTQCGIDGYKLFIGMHGFDEEYDHRYPDKSCLKGVPLDNSPSNEIENYMRAGYSSGSSGSGTDYYDNKSSTARYYDDDGFDDDDDADYDDDAMMD